jgi:hypothetical protein
MTDIELMELIREYDAQLTEYLEGGRLPDQLVALTEKLATEILDVTGPIVLPTRIITADRNKEATIMIWNRWRIL